MALQIGPKMVLHQFTLLQVSHAEHCKNPNQPTDVCVLGGGGGEYVNVLINVTWKIMHAV